MSAHRTLRERRAVMLVAATALSLSFACGEPFARTNPYDPDVPVTVILDGPDTIFNSFEQVFYPAHTDPPVFQDSAFVYQSSNPQLLSAAHGSFFTLSMPLYPAAAGVTVTVGVGAIDTQPLVNNGNGPAPHIIMFRHLLTKIIYLSQRIKNIKLRCPDTHACDPLSVGGTVAVWVDASDSLDHVIQAYASSTANSSTGAPLVTYSIRDPAIASVVALGTRVGTVTALNTGTTWIIGTRGTLADSVQLVVH